MKPTLDDLFDPKFQEKQALYENARLAVSMGWTVASKNYETVEELTAVARHLAKEIEKDLNKTLEVLESGKPKA